MNKVEKLLCNVCKKEIGNILCSSNYCTVCGNAICIEHVAYKSTTKIPELWPTIYCSLCYKKEESNE